MAVWTIWKDSRYNGCNSSLSMGEIYAGNGLIYKSDISPGSRVSGELLGYDPINKQWKLKDFQGNTFKLRTQGMAGMNQGDKLIITVGAVVTSPLGYPTITPRFIDRVKP